MSTPTTQAHGGWISHHGCTMYYTSDGQHVQAYNIRTNTQLPNLNDTPLSHNPYTGALGLRVLPDGSVLVANHYNIQRLDSSGNVIGVYYGFDDFGLAGIALDPDGETFWATDTTGAMLLYFDLSQGTLLGAFQTSAAPKGVITVPPAPPAAQN